MLPKNRKPSHPGEVLLKDFLEPNNIQQTQLAEHLGWTYARLNEIVNQASRCYRKISPLFL